jgi:tRNA pseudouridine55 synthase
MNGVLVVDKPAGWTSHDVVQRVRGILREKKIGHTGTLDPLATGVLVLCIGKATKIIRYLESDDKEYTAELKLGTTTETQDSEGRIVGTREYAPPSRDQVLDVLGQFSGVIRQKPPAYSALKVSGVPSYRLARAGTMTEHEERPVTIHRIELLEYRDPLVRFSVRCSKGTYVRTLCADIGERLGMGAHLTALVRTRAGMFRLDNARSLEQIESVVSGGDPASLMISLREALGAMPEVMVEGSDIARIAHGNTVALSAATHRTDAAPVVRIVNQDGNLVAVARVRGEILSPETVVI